MNLFDKKYEIRQATIAEEEMIMHFLGTKWRKNHVLSQSKELLEYEFREGDKLNFLLAIDRETGTLEAIQGFLYCSSLMEERRDIWGSIWKVNTEHKNLPMLGVELEKRIRILTRCRGLYGNGANPNTSVPIHKKIFKEQVVRLNQYYMLNDNLNRFKIAVVSEKRIVDNPSSDFEGVNIKLISDEKELDDNIDIQAIEMYPQKDNWYVKKRFFKYPWVRYAVYGVSEGDKKIEALVITREDTFDHAKVLRIVDYIGNQKLFAGTYNFWVKLMNENKYEYVDFYEYGMQEEYIVKAGFQNRYDGNDKNIIPNYFSPFVQQNIDIWSHFNPTFEKATFFKADADQDRPNALPL